jgi:hypothetical protein
MRTLNAASAVVFFLSVVTEDALVANATALPPAIVVSGDIQIGYEINPNGRVNGYNEILFYLTGLTGPATGSSVQAIESSLNGGGTLGTGWTDMGGTFWLDSNSSQWKSKTTNNFMGIGTYSTVNFSSSINGFSGFTRTGSGNAYTQFGGSWNQGGDSTANWVPYPDDSGTANNLIADLFVMPSTFFVQFQGEFGFTFNSGSVENVTFCTWVPEPSTLTPLASGLVGLLAYAWRRHK